MLREEADQVGTAKKRAIVVGSGPNGLSAAIALARAGVQVTVYEAAAQPGGAVRTEDLTLPGFHHDVGSAIYPLGIASPFFRTLPLEKHGLRWIEPDVPVAHPLPNGDALALLHSLSETATLFGADGPAWTKVMQPLVDGVDALLGDVLGPLFHLPQHPLLVARFGLNALRSAAGFASSTFQTERVRTLFAGLAAHSMVPLDYASTAAVGLMFGATAHTAGWPLPEGGAQAITNALVSVLESYGGEIRTSHRVDSLRALPDNDAVLLDVSPKQLLAMAGNAISPARRRPYEDFRRGPGIFKLDWALSEPIPWSNELCRRAGTVHIGGSFAEIAASERASFFGRECDRPFVLVAQQSVFDPTRAPAGKHTGWGYCHVPNGSSADRTEAIESQIERYAPGFRDCILARHAMNAPAMEAWDANLIGGDISGGAMTLEQMLRRPKLPPYSTPLPGVFLCSSSTPPGAGVHGMCGALAAGVAAAHLGI